MPVVFCVPKTFSYASISYKVHINTHCGSCGIYLFIPTLLVTLSVSLQVCCIMPVAECFKIQPHEGDIQSIFFNRFEVAD